VAILNVGNVKSIPGLKSAMGGLVNFAFCLLAAIAFYNTGHPILFSLSVVTSIVSFWSWGIMHNYATCSAKRRHDLTIEMMRAEGRSEKEIQRLDARLINPEPIDIQAVPDWLAQVNMAATLTGFVLLVWGAIVRIF